jgi:hypothetical protein
MYKIYSDSKKNRLYIQVLGQLSESEIQAISMRCLMEARRLKGSFDAVTDSDSFYPATSSGREIWETTLQKLNQMGMARVVRVNPNAAPPPKNPFQRELQYRPNQASSIAAADQLLDQNS